MKNTITIMVVDDELMMRNLLEKILQRDGYKVVTAENVQKALEILNRDKIDIVISDMKMPEMNGFDLLKIVKKEYPHIGMIMMTAYGDTYTVKDALLLGADEYITKPFKSFEVSMIVERAYWRILSGANKMENV
ncbi:MAG: response regulator [candidate division Zixibacteria bacterium]|nr:response regulator [candidate division Zixibacteria bacterium]MDD5425249.1 response regulator [candidate division Zixibacteria bacterium]